MSIRNLSFGVNSVTVSYLIRYDSLLQNATDVITKCDSFIIKCDSYYKMRRLLQIATVHSCSESGNMILNEYSSNLHTGSNYLELYFRTVTSKTYLKN